jgi:apolipoprotein D and lipocalin family protein
VELPRYIGKWYEIARLPFKQQEGCFGSTATYALRKDGNIDVVNECRDGSFDGKLRSVKGVARVVDTETNAKLEVQFFWPFWGDYWILSLDPQYRYAVVGEPKRRYLWVLSRTPTLSDAVFRALVKEAEENGYDLGALKKTPQKEE